MTPSPLKITVSLVSCLLLAPAADDQAAKAKADLKQFQGKWKVTEVGTPLDPFKDLAKQFGGEAEVKSSHDKASIAVEGDRLVWSSPAKGAWDGEWSVTLDPSVSPKVIRLSRPPLKDGQPEWKVKEPPRGPGSERSVDVTPFRRRASVA